MPKSKRRKLAKVPAAPHVAKPRKPSGSFAQWSKEAGDKEIVLHLAISAAGGCLHQRFTDEEWCVIRHDVNPNPKAHFCSELTDFSAIPDGSLQAVYCAHALQWLRPNAVPALCAELFRLLREGGFCMFKTVDAQTVATYVAHGELTSALYESPAGPVSAMDLLYGYREGGEPHRSAHTAKSLNDLLQQAGFSNVRLSRQWLDLSAVAYKYAHNDPRRDDHSKLHVDEKNGKMKLPDPLPLIRQRHPGQFKPDMLPDALNIEPNEWEISGPR